MEKERKKERKKNEEIKLNKLENIKERKKKT